MTPRDELLIMWRVLLKTREQALEMLLDDPPFMRNTAGIVEMEKRVVEAATNVTRLRNEDDACADILSPGAAEFEQRIYQHQGTGPH